MHKTPIECVFDKSQAQNIEKRATISLENVYNGLWFSNLGRSGFS